LLVGACANSHGQGMSQLQMSNQSPAKRHFGTVLMRLSFVAIVTRARKRGAAAYHGRVGLNNDGPRSDRHPVAASGS
jgi:hypothetical protein